MMDSVDNYNNDLESGNGGVPMKIFNEPPEVRRGFVVKVLGQTCGMLTIAAAICGAGMVASPEAHAYLQGDGRWIFYASVILSFSIIFSFFFSSKYIFKLYHTRICKH